MSNSTTKLPIVCAECGKRTNKVNRSLDNPDLCKTCFADAELENTHQDEHQDGKGVDCHFCDTENELIQDHWTTVHPRKVAGCEDCTTLAVIDRGEIDPIWYEEPETVHIDTIRDQVIEEMKAEAEAPKQAHFDHSACDHPKTAKARAQCRKTGPAAVFHGVIEAPLDEEPAITEMIDREDRTGAAASEADFDLDD